MEKNRLHSDSSGGSQKNAYQIKDPIIKLKADGFQTLKVEGCQNEGLKYFRSPQNMIAGASSAQLFKE